MNVTYLLGAGASANAIPVVDCIPKKTIEIKNKLASLLSFWRSEPLLLHQTDFKAILENKESIESTTYFKVFNEFLDRISGYSKGRLNIDTLARVAKYKKDDYLNSLIRRDYTVFFNLCQELYGIDPRYETFFATLLNKEDQFPSNLNLLSWNYDVQIEHVLNSFISSKSVSYDEDERLLEYGKLKISKINGGSYFLRDDKFFFSTLEKDFTFKKTDYLYEKLTSSTPFETYIKFSWDLNGEIDSLVKRVENTNILVVIGYSFPYFNSIVDRKMLNSMNSLEKIYIQDINPRGVVESFNYITSNRFNNRRGSVVSLTGVKEFFIPRELLMGDA